MFCVLQQQKQSTPIIQAVIKSVSGRIYARLAVQRIHSNAGIVCQRRHTGCFHNRIGLLKGILLKRRAGFLYIDVYTDFRLQNKLYIQFFQNLTDLHQLVLIFTC